ncbi:MAG: LuxR C-terminal-related transcriptional regulator [Microcoleaceae cyanobacterium]
MTPKQFEIKFNNLSSRKKEILEKLLAGESDKTIAKSLNIVENTVRQNIASICNTFLGKAVISGKCRRDELVDIFQRHKPEWVNLDDDIEDQVEIDLDQSFDISDNSTSVLISDNSVNSEGNQENNNVEENRESNQIEKTLREKTNWQQKRLFGIDKILDKLGDNLRSPDDYWLMSLTGAGGIGKTSLTEKLISEYGEDCGFVKLAWTTAKKNLFSGGYVGANRK